MWRPMTKAIAHVMLALIFALLLPSCLNAAEVEKPNEVDVLTEQVLILNRAEKYAEALRIVERIAELKKQQIPAEIPESIVDGKRNIRQNRTPPFDIVRDGPPRIHLKSRGAQSLDESSPKVSEKIVKTTETFKGIR